MRKEIVVFFLMHFVREKIILQIDLEIDLACGPCLKHFENTEEPKVNVNDW